MQLSEIKNIFHLELDSLYHKEEVDNFFYMLMEKYLKFEALTQLKQEKPIQYILEEAHFMGLSLKVNENVLIPRPETEELVKWIVDDDKVKETRKIRILDIGTGSGCIAIALAKEIPNAKVYAIDISPKAIEVAKQNALDNEVSVDFIVADILNLNLNLNLEFDVIVSNPPYVRELEKEEIQNNVKQYEPAQALFVPDNNALLFYDAIAEFSQKQLNYEGKLYLEINQYLAEETKILFQAKKFKKVILKKDIFENHRMLRCIK
jgi:release factor glutamine methyltransferase